MPALSTALSLRCIHQVPNSLPTLPSLSLPLRHTTTLRLSQDSLPSLQIHTYTHVTHTVALDGTGGEWPRWRLLVMIGIIVWLLSDRTFGGPLVDVGGAIEAPSLQRAPIVTFPIILAPDQAVGNSHHDGLYGLCGSRVYAVQGTPSFPYSFDSCLAILILRV